MEQTEFVVGFSELKDLLIDKYKILAPREHLRLYFTESNNQLIIHDYRSHLKQLVLSRNVKSGQTMEFLERMALKVIQLSLLSSSPSKMLNENFLLYGYFTF